MNFVPKGESGESEKGARSEEGLRNLEIGRVSHFCTVPLSCQPLCTGRVSPRRILPGLDTVQMGDTDYKLRQCMSATLHTLHKPSVPSAHFVSARGADGRH